MISDHYARAAPVYAQLGDLDGLYTPANVDFTGWYHSRPAGRAGDVPAGFDGRARPWALSPDYDEIAQKLDRVLYSTVNYADPNYFAESWSAYRWLDDGRGWDCETNPLPGYGDLKAYAPFADIDLADGVKKHRVSGDVPRQTVEEALEHYIRAFSELCGGRDAVFALDSVGGAYVMVAPSVTRPISEEFDYADRGLIYEELTQRLNGWLKSVRDHINNTIDGVEGVFEPDMVNHKNRLYKAPLSVHKRLDGVVMPIDVDAVSYDYTPLEYVDDAVVDVAETWAREFTSDYSGRVENLVAELWPSEMHAADDWRDALEAWLTDLEEDDDTDTVADASAGTSSAGPSDAGVADDMQEVIDALDDIEAIDVAEETIVHRWNDDHNSGDGVRPFYPIWGPNSNGTANFIGEDKQVWRDDGAGDKGTVVEMALIASEDVDWRRGRIAKGSDWVRGIKELRKLGFDVPLPPADDNVSPYYNVDLQSVHDGKEDVHEDRQALLRACLLARDEYDLLEGEKPPYAALVAVAQMVGLQFKDPEEDTLGKDSYRLARKVFDDLDAPDVQPSP